MPDDVEPEIEIRKMEPGDSFSRLSLGDQKFTPLKTFAKKRAHEYQERSLAATYVAVDMANPKRAIAYLTLVCGEVVLQEGDGPVLNDDGLEYPYFQYPAVKIARLAVDSKVRKYGIGKALVFLAIGISTEHICPNVGCRFVMVDAKQESVDFYDKIGFRMLDTDENKAREQPVMFIDLAKLG